jgi:chromosome segregation ATPase
MSNEASVRSSSWRLHPSIVLSAYLEPLVRGRRVAVLGDATSGLADELADRGARLLHVYDPDATRVAEALARVAPDAAHGVTYAPLAGDLGVRDGAFEVVIVPDLSIFADPPEAIRRARRLVPATGAAIFVVPNAGVRARRLLDASPKHAAPPAAAPTTGQGAPRTPGYYELFDLASLQFAKVRMVGQAPFVGYTVADFAPNGEPEVTVDTSLVEASEEPEHFIAIASDRAVSLEAYAVVALPWEQVAAASAPDPLVLAAADARATALNAELDRVQERETRLGALAAREAEERVTAQARVAELSAEGTLRDGKLKEAEARAGDNHVRAERLSNHIRDMEEELARQRDRATKLVKQLDDEKRARTKAELEAGILRSKPEVPGAQARIDALGAELDVARARVAELELEQTETRRRPVPPPEDEKHVQQVRALEQAVDAALREAAGAAAQRDAQVARARELEARVGQAEHQAARASRRTDEAELSAKALEARLDERSARVVALETDLASALSQAGAAAEARAKVAALTAELAAVRARATEDADAQAVAAATVAEISALEAALVERGRVITSLTRDLREAERVGKDLVEELEAGGWGALGDPGAAPGDDLRARLDALATSAARSEADLQAASWRITQLERELADSKGASTEPTAVQRELELALSAARDEVASLRRALASVPSS